MFVRECLRCYTADYTVVEYKFRAYSGSTCGRERLGERMEKLHAAPRHLYEVDAEPQSVSTEELISHQVCFSGIIFYCIESYFNTVV